MKAINELGFGKRGLLKNRAEKSEEQEMHYCKTKRKGEVSDNRVQANKILG